GAVGILALTLFMARFIRGTFIPPQDQAMFKVAIELPIGSNLNATQEVLEDLVEQIRKLPGVENTFYTAGGGALEEVHKGEIIVNLVPRKQRDYTQEQIKQYLRDNLQHPANVLVTAQDVTAIGGSRSQQIQFNIRGSNW